MVTINTEHYIRLLLLNAQGATPVLRETLINFVKQTSNKTLGDFLLTFQGLFKTMKAKRILIEPEYNKLLQGSAVDINEWDTSLLCFVLLNCCTLKGKLNEFKCILLKEANNDLDSFVKVNKASIDTYKGNGISEEQYNIMFSANGIPTDNELWDMDLITFILINVCTGKGQKCVLEFRRILQIELDLKTSSLNLTDFLKCHKVQLRVVKAREKLDDLQFKELFPSSGLTDMYKWDNNTLRIVVLNCTSSLSNQAMQATNKLRDIRNNCLAHKENAEMANLEYLNKSKEMIDAIGEIVFNKHLPNVVTELINGPIDIKSALHILKDYYKDSSGSLQIMNNLDVFESKVNSIEDRMKAGLIDEGFGRTSGNLQDLLKLLYKLEKKMPDSTYSETAEIECVDMMIVIKSQSEDVKLKAEKIINTAIEKAGQNVTEKMKAALDVIRTIVIQDGRTIVEIKSGGYSISRLDESTEINNEVLHQMCRKYGRKSKEVTEACDRIKLRILSCSISFKDVWPSYRPANQDDIVFVVFTQTRPERDVELLPSLESFDIIYKKINEYGKEDNQIHEHSEQQMVYENDEERKGITAMLRKHSTHLMNSHSNLNIITASPVKSKAFELGKHSVKRKPSIVFYVSLKGFIPIQENELPIVIGSYKTDVREGAFTFYNDPPPEPYIQKLKIGCSIGESLQNGHFGGTGGTLGAFVDLPNGTVGCITSAHTLLSSRELNECKKSQKLIPETNPTTIYQPAPSLSPNAGGHPFGRVVSVIYKTGDNEETGVEAGLITIQDKTRYPDNGLFPRVTEGFTEESQLNYMSGEIFRSIPDNIWQCTFYKYGATTGMTRGAFKLQGCALRTSRMDVYPNCELYNQIEICSVDSKPFAKPGDSGALVLVAYDKDPTDLRAIGILTGGNIDCTIFYVTPIWEVLNALGLGLHLKSFARINQVPIVIDDDHGHARHSELEDIKASIEEFKINMNIKVDKINTNIAENVAQVVEKTVEDKVGQVKTEIEHVKGEVERMGTKINSNFERLFEAIHSTRTSNNN